MCWLKPKEPDFCTKTIKTIIRLRKLDKDSRQEAETLLDTYKTALGLD